jgi:catechol 2,3-dioxygenase-like lactoylglutathione lyase family enzyme
MTTDQAAQSWSIRSTLIAVSNLDRSVAFYRDIGPFEEIAREDAVAVLGDASPGSLVLLLRETRGIHGGRYGQQSLGLRSIVFNIESAAELDRIESILRAHDLFTSRRDVADGTSELVRGRDPDNLPLAFVRYAEGGQIGANYYRTVANMVYSLDT